MKQEWSKTSFWLETWRKKAQQGTYMNLAQRLEKQENTCAQNRKRGVGRCLASHRTLLWCHKFLQIDTNALKRATKHNNTLHKCANMLQKMRDLPQRSVC